MTQQGLVLHYLKFHDEILPAKLGGRVYDGVMFGSEISRVCRSLRKKGILGSTRRGKFEVFYRLDKVVKPFVGSDTAESFLRDWGTKPQQQDHTLF